MRQVADLDKQIAGLLAVLETSPAQTQSDPATPSEASAKAKPRASASHRYQPAYDVRGELLRHLGVDLTSIPGINVTTAQTLWAELGGDLGAFKSGKRFASWLSLCPDNRVSGGKLLSAHTKPSANRAARAQQAWRRGGAGGPPPTNSRASSMRCSPPNKLTAPSSTPKPNNAASPAPSNYFAQKPKIWVFKSLKSSNLRDVT